MSDRRGRRRDPLARAQETVALIVYAAVLGAWALYTAWNILKVLVP